MSENPQDDKPSTLATDFSVIKAHAGDYLEAVNEYIGEQRKAFEPEIRDLVHYCLEKGGKRIRPVLVYFSGYREGEPDPALVKLGTVIELVHTATLVHDDIIDDASVRHGRDSVMEKYGSSVAVLLGDALFSHALRLAAEFPTVEVCREVAASTRTVCTGEIHQSFRRGDEKMDLASYYRCIEMKTAELFRVACHLGAAIGGYSREFINASGAYGYHLGTAYQIFDDYADIFSTEERMGKTLNTDILKGKFTLPIILLLESLNSTEKEKFLEELNNSEEVPVDTIATLMRTHEIKGKVMDHFNQQIQRGSDVLNPFGDLPATLRLRELLSFVSAQIELLA
ncbi:MAG: polyprenyl synthetase family protein [Opitutales bacterium]|nr:polyprenyl synthetase family protein [Opitutales bacterium]